MRIATTVVFALVALTLAQALVDEVDALPAERVVGDDRVHGNPEDGEQDRRDHAGSVLARRAVEHGRHVELREQAHDTHDRILRRHQHHRGHDLLLRGALRRHRLREPGIRRGERHASSATNRPRRRRCSIISHGAVQHNVARTTR